MKVLGKIIAVFLVLILILGYINHDKFLKIDHKYRDLLVDLDETKNVSISEYTIYGKHFNLKGTFQSDNAIDNISLVLKSNEQELTYDVFYDKENHIFKTNEYINQGILLDNIAVGNYLVLLKVTSNESIYYYNLNNITAYGNLEYYTLTKNNKNNKIIIDYENYKNYNYLKLEVTECKLPTDVYDIVIDPGHGGVDPGASNGKYKEDTINLDYGLSLKEALTDLGLKVKLTREEDIDLKTYGHGSRTAIPYETKAKLMLSVHMNSSSTYIKNGGVEVYIASGDNPYIAKKIADSIVTNTSTVYSPNTHNRLSNGVYERIYTESDIKDNYNTATRDGWIPYDIKDNTTYYYFIRETGGIVTKAFADGRNPKYEANPYYNANYGVEAYLIEFGYISNSTNLKILLNEKNSYIKAVKESVRYYLENTY